MESKGEIKVKAVMFNKLMITTDSVESKIILSPGNNNDKVTLKEVQTVVMAGPFCSQENGSGLKPGDRIVVDPANLRATRYGFNKHTGEYIPYNSKIALEDIDFYLLINDRDVVLVLED